MKKYKVKVTKACVEPMAYGGQANYGLDLTGSVYPDITSIDNDYVASSTLQPVDRDAANVEAEKGETVVGNFNNSDALYQMTVGGKRHSEGGTPLNLPGGAFIFSDTKKLRLKSSEVTAFGKDEKSGKSYTPAELAKQYDINKYQAIVDDPKADKMKKKTAELMIDNYKNKLAQLALVQEAKKGFPDGIPDIAMPYIMMQQEGAGLSEDPFQEFAREGGQLPKYARAGTVNPWDITPYGKAKTKQGNITPTGKDNKYDRGNDYLKQWEELIPGITKLDNKTAQSRIYDYTLTNNPDAVRTMWETYGITNKGKKDPVLNKWGQNGRFAPGSLKDDQLPALKSAYADGFFGARQLDPFKPKMPTTPVLEHVPVPGDPLNIPIPKVAKLDEPLTPPSVPVPGDYTPTGTAQTYGYMTPDKLSFASGLKNRMNIKKYMPWEAPVNAVTPDPTFYDPNRELANNAELMNTQMMYNSHFSGPQALGARNSAVAGNAATNAANILSKVNNQNVGVANQFAGVNAEIMNHLMDAQSQRATRLFDKTTIVNQQYDNSVMKADNEILKAGINAWDNRSKLNLTNSTNPYYYIDPRTGNMVFRKGHSIESITGKSAVKQGTYDDYYNEGVSLGIKNKEQLERYAYDRLTKANANFTDKNMDGQADAVKYSGRYSGQVGPY